MNGDNTKYLDSKFQDMDKRLEVLETVYKQSWAEHDKRSTEHWDNFKTEISELKAHITTLTMASNDTALSIAEKMGALPCASTKMRINALGNSLTFIRTILAGIILAITGMVMSLIKK